MPGYFTLYRIPAGQFMFKLKGGNHQVLLTSQVYTSRQAALDGIESARNNSQIESRFERKIDENNAPYFVLCASNGQVIGKSQMYCELQAMEKGVTAVIANGASNIVKEFE